MIFISHTNTDKPLVEPIALKLAEVFGSENVFFDSWSIQPGEGIIDKMDHGLSSCRFFFFFVSKKSLQSNMVKLEWQNAIYKSARGEVKLVPVRLDDCIMPQVLLQTLYIDIYTQGPAIALRQMIDVIRGQNTYRADEIREYQNIRGYVTKLDNGFKIEIRAETYMEPHSQFLVLIKNSEEEVAYSAEEGQFQSGFQKDLRLNNGIVGNAIMLGRFPATSPGFPFIITLTQRGTKPIELLYLLRAISRHQYAIFPHIITN